MGFAEAWKKTQTTEENIHPDELPKLPEPPFDSFDSDPKRHISKKKNAPDPAPRTPDVRHGAQKNLGPIGTIEDVNNCLQTPANESQARPGDDWFDDMICLAIEELSDAGAAYTDASEEDRERARALEMEYTVAANNGDSPRFWKALREWKAIWIEGLH
jgi:hypothetical protein